MGRESRDFHTWTEVESEIAEVNGDGTTAPPPHLRHWAEFPAEEPTQPQGRNGKPKPSSLFQWALCAEQERKKGLVGAGRWANRRGGDATSRRPLVTAHVCGLFAFQSGGVSVSGPSSTAGSMMNSRSKSHTPKDS